MWKLLSFYYVTLCVKRPTLKTLKMKVIQQTTSSKSYLEIKRQTTMQKLQMNKQKH